MKKQDYSNHIRYYTPHHFVFYPVVLVLFVLSLVLFMRHPEERLIWAFLGITVAVVAWLSYMLRQHYSLINQNRIVRLELRFRYYVLTHKRFEEVEQRLSAGQVHALRFAPDEELPALVERTLKENLTADQIKRSIRNWLPDEMRV